MSSRGSGEFRRSFVSALAAVLTAAVPSLAATPAWAGKGADEATAADPPAKAPPATKKKPHAKHKGKKTAARAATKSPKRCAGTPVTLDRGGLEGQSLTLVDCHDRPNEGAQAALSVLARPWGAQKPDLLTLRRGAKSKAPRGHAGEVAPGVRLLDRGLLARVDAIGHRFPGRPISLVSGYRPQSRGSLHQSARALDLRVAGVSNEELVAFCKTLADTGCGYYPNSSFVHFDVRNPGTGGVSWIDASGPGETPHYVHQWPPPPEDADRAVLPPDDEPHDGSERPLGRRPARRARLLPRALPRAGLPRRAPALKFPATPPRSARALCASIAVRWPPKRLGRAKETSPCPRERRSRRRPTSPSSPPRRSRRRRRRRPPPTSD